MNKLMNNFFGKLLDKVTDMVFHFFGSWWAVLVHTIWFSVWFFLNLNVHVLTLIVSLEAIYLCIFLLMAANKVEAERLRRESRERARDRGKIDEDFKLDQKADRQLVEVRKLQKEHLQEIREIKSELRRIREK